MPLRKEWVAKICPTALMQKCVILGRFSLGRLSINFCTFSVRTSTLPMMLGSDGSVQAADMIFFLVDKLLAPGNMADTMK